MAGVVLRIDRDPWLGSVEEPQLRPSRPSSEEPNELQLYGQAAETLQPKSLRLLPTRIIGNVKEGETPSQNQDFNLG
jgi:hypothetical protein